LQNENLDMSDHPSPPRILSGPADLSPEDRALLDQARNALAHSYSPYSGFRVGAAIKLDDGRVVTGFNMENASYPVCLCAEQTTIAAVRTQYPGQRMMAMAITVSNPARPVGSPASPCGQCRQLLFEQERINGSEVRLILQGEKGEVWIFQRLADLLPYGFGGELL
jgi:cytidine deaminase